LIKSLIESPKLSINDFDQDVIITGFKSFNSIYYQLKKDYENISTEKNLKSNIILIFAYGILLWLTNRFVSEGRFEKRFELGNEILLQVKSPSPVSFQIT